MTPELYNRLGRWQSLSWKAGVGALLLCLVSLFFARSQVFRSYWFAWIFFAGLGFGSLAMLLLQYLTGGAWGRAIQRPAEAAVMTLPWMALLLVPALFGLADIFPWAPGSAQAGGFAAASWPHKHAFLTVFWFIFRAALYFLVLLTFGLLLRAWSLAQEHPLGRGFLATLSGPGLVAWVFCMNFAAADWVMSLQPQWYSTMLAIIFMVSQFLSALALAILTVTMLARFGFLALSTKQLHDLGNLLLAFVVFWTYVSFSQFLIIWSGNLPREISWYLPRREGGWQYLAVFLALFQFAVPFALLLSRAAKRHHRRLAPIAALVLLSNLVNVYWLVAPSVQPGPIRIHWLDLLALAGVGGIWAFACLRALRKRPLLVPEIPEEAAHG